jgi:hypothetical protein
MQRDSLAIPFFDRRVILFRLSGVPKRPGELAGRSGELPGRRKNNPALPDISAYRKEKDDEQRKRFHPHKEVSSTLCYWPFEELRAIIGAGQKKSPGPA